ncbi:hypothetical protein ACCO45_004599 [Purpureocillium lilacinum]|uniref:Uncharacterized protein n=1 Tax=Purpureocillium lilacinum TaxID=33203 RepID=A0ACC4DSZ4_PURLI
MLAGARAVSNAPPPAAETETPDPTERPPDDIHGIPGQLGPKPSDHPAAFHLNHVPIGTQDAAACGRDPWVHERDAGNPAPASLSHLSPSTPVCVPLKAPAAASEVASCLARAMLDRDAARDARADSTRHHPRSFCTYVCDKSSSLRASASQYSNSSTNVAADGMMGRTRSLACSRRPIQQQHMAPQHSDKAGTAGEADKTDSLACLSVGRPKDWAMDVANRRGTVTAGP